MKRGPTLLVVLGLCGCSRAGTEVAVTASPDMRVYLDADGGFGEAQDPSVMMAVPTTARSTRAQQANNLLEPSYTGTNRDTRLALALLRDLGWPAQAAVVPTLAEHRLLGAALLAAVQAYALRARQRRSRA